MNESDAPTGGIATLPDRSSGASAAQFAHASAYRLRHNRNFTIFWLGQSLSSVGDAVAVIAIPLLVLTRRDRWRRWVL